MADHRADFVTLRQWEDTDGLQQDQYGDWPWPGPAEYTESRAIGHLRTAILRRLQHDPDDDDVEVRVIERASQGGSEWTAETYLDIEVWIHEGRQAQKVWESDNEVNPIRDLTEWLDS